MSAISVDWNPNAAQLRTFGTVGAAVFGALAALTVWRGSILGFALAPASVPLVAYGLTTLAAIAAVLAWTMPRALRSLYVIAIAVSLPIGFVVSYLVLGVLFYLVLTPFGLAFRLLGRDALARGFDTSASSYWVRRPAVTDSDRYYHQY